MRFRSYRDVQDRRSTYLTYKQLRNLSAYIQRGCHLKDAKQMSISLQRPGKARLARLVIADDHELARAGLRTMLISQNGIELLAEAKNGGEALELCRHLRPDLALLDVRMPDMDGLATCRCIKQEVPITNVILITMHENPHYLLEALRAGASAYVLKDVTQRELLITIRRVLRGEAMLDPKIVAGVLGNMTGNPPHLSHLPSVQLSPREREVLQLLAQGLTNREIAHTLTVSTSTIKIHVEHILMKLDVADRTQAAVRAIELGLLQTSCKEP
jgi:DNA-binding NarL/FixJ family response regulator